MKITRISDQLNKIGLSKFWQFYLVIHAIVAISVIFISDVFWMNITNSLLTILVSTGVFAAIRLHKHKPYPWGFLLGGVVLIGFAIVINSFAYAGFQIDADISFWIEEAGIILITVFALSYMLLFEKTFNLKGFTIDYSLLVISSVCFTFLIFPNLLHTFVYEMDLIQQLLLTKVFFGLLLLSMAVLHHILSKSLELNDTARIITILFLVSHFYLETLLSFNLAENSTLVQRISWSCYQLAGTFAILFAFIDRLSLDYIPHASSRLGNQFMWVASIIAILVIPVGLIIRWIQGEPSIDPIIIGLTSFALSIIVIWRFIVLIKKTSEQRKRLKSIVHTDTLTGLSNYLGYLEKLLLARFDNTLVITINIEDFKAINDLHGRDFGDEVLKSLAKRLKQLPNILLAARIGSDSFIAVFQISENKIQKLSNTVQQELGIWDSIQGTRITVPLTYGASYSNDLADPEKLARQAEKALKTARTQHTSFYLYTEKNDNKFLPRHELRQILQQAVDNNYLPIHFQPIYNLEDGSLKALELLIRVESQEHGLLLPRQFLEQAKSYGLLTSLTEVCVNMIAKNFAELPDVIININLPPYMLKNSQLLNKFISLFDDNNLPPTRFCIEVTEDSDISAKVLIPSIQQLKDHGFTIAMDDFGTGYSSLDRLSVLAVDTVKIDRSLLLSAASGNMAILECAITLAKRLGISAVVEGVETNEQLSLIKSLGADSVQGFLLSEPVSADEAVNLSLNANNVITEF